jgi:ribosomal protein L29
MAEVKKTTNEKESARKIKDLKIELLKNPTKKASIKKEIARLLTMENQTKLDGENK